MRSVFRGVFSANDNVAAVLWSLDAMLAKTTRSDSLGTTLKRGSLYSSAIPQSQKKVSEYCIAERMSWAADGRTTRPEDQSYSLLGLFEVNMPVLYGEGAAKAFQRLQQEIIKDTLDQSIFAWKRRPCLEEPEGLNSSLLATSPIDFLYTPKLTLWKPDYLTPFVMTNAGLTICFHVLANHEHIPRRGWLFANLLPQPETDRVYAILQCGVDKKQSVALHLERIPNATFISTSSGIKKLEACRRVECSSLKLIPSRNTRCVYKPILVVADRQFELVKQSLLQGVDLSPPGNRPVARSAQGQSSR